MNHECVFGSLPWHNAELLELFVDRREAGTSDNVQLRVAWHSGGETTVIFRGCYAMLTDMNFGIVAEERIESASIVDEDPVLVSIRDRWSRIGVSLSHLRCYRLETSSTASVMRIYAGELQLIECDQTK